MEIDLGILLGIMAGTAGLMLIIFLAIVVLTATSYSRGFDDGWEDAVNSDEDRHPQERD